MTEERQMVVMAVLEGSLPASMLTDDEIVEMENNLFELIAEKIMPTIPHNAYTMQ